MKLLVATGNAHKLEEFARILAPMGFQLMMPADAGASLEGVVENGATFAENAAIKARALFERTGIPAVADDSGLCVDALDGRPGIHSARYMGEDTPHSEKIKGLLRELAGVPAERRTARFVASICCVLGKDEVIACEGSCEGVIGFAPSGGGGFGYDPVFYVGDKSFGELTPEEKDAVSHRGRALREFAEKMKTYLDNRETAKGEHNL